MPLYIGLHIQVTMASKPFALKLETDEMLPMKGRYISKQKQWADNCSNILGCESHEFIGCCTKKRDSCFPLLLF